MQKLRYSFVNQGLLGCLLFMLGSPASGLQWTSGFSGGLLYQPTSQYAHHGYGISLGLLDEDQNLGLNVEYFRRPEFEAQGFKDTDELGALNLSGRILQYKRLHLRTGIGLSRIQGSIVDTTDEQSLHYQLSALYFSAQILIRWRYVFVGLEHGYHMAVASREQFEAYVVWPFKTYTMTVGLSL